MTDTDHLRALYDAQMRGTLRTLPAGVVHEQDGPVVRIVGEARGHVVTVLPDTGLRGVELDRLIAAQRDYFAARGEAVEWRTHGHDGPADLRPRLRAAGFAPQRRKSVLIGSAPESAGAPLVPEGVVVRRVRSREDLRRIAAMESTVWGRNESWLGDALTARLEAAPGETAVLVAEAQGEVICAGWILFRPGTDFATLSGGSTLRGWRGQGIYRALVARRAALAVEQGVPHLHVDATDESAPILRRLGFREVTTTTSYVRAAPAPAR
ncbi:GNAT family N-acetyltransferase [Streptomyces albidus (ex Kaewkla and Franco 2022)]|uniref:GNAT family N-acetyltransferase n=1 Tax=Streptomyces albidus (ex Kaewkla and Franco 2022) TaxID=722709 RepID=UPI0015EE67C9|nr:GNAT family N-acetyltransferase [Streptomyces albidus (ex Kaewkla and Franco 2022)]